MKLSNRPPVLARPNRRPQATTRRPAPRRSAETNEKKELADILTINATSYPVVANNPGDLTQQGTDR